MKFFSSLKTKASSFLDQYSKDNPTTYAAAQQAIGGILIADGLFGLENPFDGQKKRPGIFGTLAGMVVGVVFMLAPVFGNFIGLNKMTATTAAEVVTVGQNTSPSTDGGQSCPLTVKYTVDGQEYTKQSNLQSTANCSLVPGQQVQINYDPANPGSWAYDLKTLGLAFKVFFWVGVFALVTSMITFIIRLLSIVFGWKLLRNGRKLAASLPQGTDLKTAVEEIKKNFSSMVFNFPGSQPTAQQSPPPPEPKN